MTPRQVNPVAGERGRTHAEVLTSTLHKPYHLKGSRKESARLDRVVQKIAIKTRVQVFLSGEDSAYDARFLSAQPECFYSLPICAIGDKVKG
jgi:hypothetical protein